MYRKLLLTIILILNCQFSILNCQSWEHFYTYRHFGMKEGLPQSQVFESFQDSYGYLWFSTNDGVCRFDGISFKNYSMKDLHTDTRVLYINQYETAILLISPKNIIFLYPDQTMEYYPLPENYRIHGNHVSIALFENDIFLFNCLLELQQNRLEFTLFRFNLTDKTYTKITENLPELMACISEQKLYAISFFTIKNQKVALYRLDNDMLQKVNAISMEQDDFMLWPNLTRKKDWFATITKKREQQENTHLYKIIFEKDSVRFEYISELPSVNLHPCIERLDENRLLFGFGHSDFFSYMYYFDEQRFLPFPINFNTMMNDILPDHDGNLWFSTESGLFQCTRFLFDSYQLKIASFDNIWGVIKDAHHNVWFSSHTYGFLRADKQGDLHNVHLTYNGQKVSPVYGYMGNCRDSRGRVFLSFHEGIAVYDPEKGKPNQLDHIPTGCSLALYYDTRHNEICFGGITDTGTTLNILHTNGEITTYPFLGVKHIISICRDGNQKLRLGTFTGEAFLDEEKQTIVFDTLPRPYKSVICMTLDDKGILWKGGFNGLFAEDKQGNDHQIFDQTTVFAINYYDKYIVFGSKDKLHILDLQSYHKDNTISIRTFGYYDGFDVMECGQNGASIDDEGFVWVAGGDKVIRFHPEQLMKLPPIVAQKPYLAAIYFADKNSEWTLLPQNSSIILKNKENYLRFDILLACVSAPDKLTFRYRLEGYNDQWTTSHERTYIFQNLPFGKYRLEVQATVNGEDWSESELSPFITISNPFWLTIPGLLLILLGIAGLTLLIVYYTRIIIIRKEEEKLQIEQLKRRAIRAKFIPHFTGNVLNSINYLISKKPQAAQKYISDFSEFTHHTLLNSERLYRTIQEELTYTELYLKLEKLRFEEKLEYEITVDSDIDQKQEVPTMALQTFSENAIKHGLRPKPEGGKITIRVYNQESYIVLSVEDNGIGREKAQTIQTEGTKEGLKIVQQQLDIFNKEKSQKAYLQIIDLYDTKEHPSGTRFELWIPHPSLTINH